MGLLFITIHEPVHCNQIIFRGTDLLNTYDNLSFHTCRFVCALHKLIRYYVAFAESDHSFYKCFRQLLISQILQ